MARSRDKELDIHDLRQYSLIPFWFWNDDLSEDEIVRQMDDFQRHGVHGFLIHARVGLPKSIGWMSDRMLHFVRVAVEEAARKRMSVVLYDEGMYPSGSAGGLVVELNPAHRCRCLARQELHSGEQPVIEDGWNLVAEVSRANGDRIAVIDRPTNSVIRGLHYIGEGPEEETPPAADLLNPESVASFLDIVYNGYAEAVGDFFGSTIIGIFTDEPGPLSKRREGEISPGTTGILEHINRILGYDFTPHLPVLWYEDEPDAAYHRDRFTRAITERLRETYFEPLSKWCSAHGINLMGHPKLAGDISTERFFQVPGQDLVWRAVLPGPTALEGPDSTTAKCASSAKAHLGRSRCSMELYGAYGDELTWDEVVWLANWCIVRGIDTFIPHAFYYSMRGCRKDERPPDVGPNSPWWDSYKDLADYCAATCHLNANSRHICDIAILSNGDCLPWEAAKVCFEHQRDFNYLEARHLWEDAAVDESGIKIAEMHYKLLIIDHPCIIPDEAKPSLDALASRGRVILFDEEAQSSSPNLRVAGSGLELMAVVDERAPADVTVSPASPDLRLRHTVINGRHYHILFNEGDARIAARIKLAVDGPYHMWHPCTQKLETMSSHSGLQLDAHEMVVLCVDAGKT